MSIEPGHFQQIIEQLPVIVYIRNLDESRSCRYISPRSRSILGYGPSECETGECFWLAHIHPEDVAAFQLDESEALATGKFKSHYRMIREDGTIIWLHDQAEVFSLPDGNKELRGVISEVTEPRRVQDSLREHDARFRALADSSPALFWGAAATGELTYFNRRWLEFTGRNIDEALHHGWLQCVHPDDRRLITSVINAHLASHAEIRTEFRMLRHDGAFRWLTCTGTPQFSEQGQFLGFIGGCIDITDRKMAEQQLVHDALHDSLTSLPNRALFLDRLGRALARTRRNREYKFAVLFLDLDRFKVVNDSLGHVLGDELLVAITRRLGDSLRPADTVARFGGDEFAILLEDIASAESAGTVAERIHQQLRQPFNISGHEIFTSASIGIAIGSDLYSTADDLLRDADTAMHRTKSQGPGRHQLFESEMHAKAVKLLVLDTDLRRAVEQNAFSLVYQPIISLKTGRIMRFEALIRWKHPERGWISPADFIPVAEENDLIVPIGDFVLRESLKQLSQWREKFSELPWLAMNVNLSGKQFSKPDLIDKVQAELSARKIDPRWLNLEITETCLMDSPEAARTILHRLRELGTSISMDDFGTGYSSLGYLHNFPLDGLKIDRSFVSGSDRARGGRIVHTIITMAHDLGLPCTAEGIETVEQARWLMSLGCEYAQGYLFAKPLTPADAEKLLATTVVVPQMAQISQQVSTALAG